MDTKSLRCKRDSIHERNDRVDKSDRRSRDRYSRGLQYNTDRVHSPRHPVVRRNTSLGVDSRSRRSPHFRKRFSDDHREHHHHGTDRHRGSSPYKDRYGRNRRSRSRRSEQRSKDRSAIHSSHKSQLSYSRKERSPRSRTVSPCRHSVRRSPYRSRRSSPSERIRRRSPYPERRASPSQHGKRYSTHRERRSSPQRRNARHERRHSASSNKSFTRKTSTSRSSESSHSENVEDLPEAQQIQKLLGISQFDSSKGKNHMATDAYGTNKKTKRKYRQYMNRRGGFNRPLSPVF